VKLVHNSNNIEILITFVGCFPQVSIVICMAFVLAWSPYAVVSMWSAWGFQVPNTTSIVTRLFAKSASFYNPLIYFGMSSKFRNDVAVLLPCRAPRRTREVVRLQQYKNIQPPERKHAAVAQPDPSPPENTDSGLNSPTPTQYPCAQGAVQGDLPWHIETSQYWCDRL